MHVFAQAAAEVVSKPMMVLAVNGATLVVAAIQRERYALKDFWSLSHLPFDSHATSYMILFVKKTLDVFKMPSTRDCHKVVVALAVPVPLDASLVADCVICVSYVCPRLWRESYNIPHDSGSIQEYSLVVRPLYMVQRSAVVCVVRAIIKVVRAVH